MGLSAFQFVIVTYRPLTFLFPSDDVAVVGVNDTPRILNLSRYALSSSGVLLGKVKSLKGLFVPYPC